MTTAVIRASLVLDNSTYGLSPEDMQLELGQGTFNRLMEYMRYSPMFKASAENKFGLFLGGENVGHYELVTLVKDGGKKKQYFINATATPARLMSGDNVLPVVLTPRKRESNRDTLLRTLKYANRLVFSLLERLPEFVAYKAIEKEDGKYTTKRWTVPAFAFSDKERRDIENGEIALLRLQVAWYSGGMGGLRNTALAYLTYVLANNTFSVDVDDDGRVMRAKDASLSKYLGINARVWPNSSNLTLVSYSGTKPQLKLVVYAKDEEIRAKTKGEGTKATTKVSDILRFDVTFMHNALRSLFGLKSDEVPTIRSFESRYALDTESSDDGKAVDTPFTRNIAYTVYEHFKLPYLLNTSVERFDEMYANAERVASGSDALAKVAAVWLEGSAPSSQTELAKMLGITRMTLYNCIAKLREDLGIDFDVPATYHAKMLHGLIENMQTYDEVIGSLLKRNQRVPRREKEERLEQFQTVVKENLLRPSRRRVFRVSPIDEKELHIYKLLRSK